MFRSSERCRRYEYVSFDLQNPMVTPVNNQFQCKSGYHFVVDCSGESHPFDWYNAYFESDFRISNKATDAPYGANDEEGIINGGYSMINQLKVDYNGVTVLDTPGINHGSNIKSMLEFSKGYSDTLGQSMFHYVDTTTAAASSEFVADAANHIATRNANYNEGFARRKAPLSAGGTTNITLPLNKYSFFDSFKNDIAPNGKVALDVSLESDNNVLFCSNAAAEGQYIITKWVLWVPKMVFNSNCEDLYLSRYLDNHSWTYLKEHLEISPSSQHRQATF